MAATVHRLPIVSPREPLEGGWLLLHPSLVQPGWRISHPEFGELPPWRSRELALAEHLWHLTKGAR